MGFGDAHFHFLSVEGLFLSGIGFVEALGLSFRLKLNLELVAFVELAWVTLFVGETEVNLEFMAFAELG